MNRITTALCSYGMSGKVFHGPFLRTNPHFHLKYILERTHSKSVEDFPEATIVRSYEELLKAPDLDLVVVNVPTPLHFTFAKQALEAGKHVVVEKPLATNMEEAEELASLSKTMGLSLVTYQNRRWASDFLAIRQLMKEGKLTHIHTFETHFDRYRPGLNSKRWKETLEPGGGVFYDLGSHLIDQAVLIFGAPDSLYCKLFSQREDSPSHDGFDLRLSYPNLEVRLKGGSLVLDPGPRYIVHTPTASFVKSGSDAQEEQLIDGMLPNEPGYGQEPDTQKGLLTTTEGSTRIQCPQGTYHTFYEQLASHLLDGTPSPVAISDSLIVMKIIDLANQSHRQNQVLKFP